MENGASRQVHLRQDLQQSWQAHQGKRYLVIKDPLTRRYFRFSEQQAAILELLATPIPIETLANEASLKLKGKLPVSAAQAFCDSLEAKDLLDTPAVGERLGTTRRLPPSRRSGMLYKQVASFDPTVLFDLVEPYTRWAFNLPFQLVGAGLILAGLSIFGANWNELKAATPDLLNFWTIVLVWPVVFGVSAFHEFCHGLTCRHFKGEVKEVGFMLIYFTPAFYCDISDSWMFPSRKQRMAVGLAGAYGQLMFWGFCAVLWRLTDPSTAINHVVLVVVLFSGLQTLFNLNPLLKFDGYYVLADWMEVPNLRAKAFQAVRRWVRGDPKRKELPKQGRLLAYGFCAVVFSSTVLVSTYAAIYTWATERWATAGLVGFAFFSLATLGRKAVESITGSKGTGDAGSIGWGRKLVVAAVLIVLLLVALFTHLDLKVPADFQIIAQSEVFARPEASGVLTEILVREGDRVHKGDVLARMRDFSRQSEIEKTSGELREKQSILLRLQAGSRPEEITKQESLIAAKKVEVANARRNEEEKNRLREVRRQRQTELEQLLNVETKIQTGVKAQVFPQVQLDEAHSNVEVKRVQVSEAEAAIRSLDESAGREADLKTKELAVLQDELALMKAGNRKELIRESEAEVNKLASMLELLKQQATLSEVKAPIDGTVAEEFPERKLNQKMEAGANFIRLVDTSALIAVMDVPELELEDVKIGNAVWMRARSFATVDIPARVDFIAPVGRENESHTRVVTVRALVTGDISELKPGMTGVARIYCGPRRVIDLMTRRARRWFRTEFWHLLP